MDRIRLLVADDHPMLREGLVAVLGTQPDFEVVGEAADGDEVVRLAKALDPDVILLDLEMPHTDGVEALERLRDAGSRARTVVFTAYDTDERILGSLRAGARGYLLKGADQAEILRAVAAVAGGEAIFGAAVAARILEFFAAGRPRGTEVVFPQLTAREHEVLDLIAAGRSNTELAATLVLSPKTVRNHVSNIFTKLQVADRAQAIVLARDAGLGR